MSLFWCDHCRSLYGAANACPTCGRTGSMATLGAFDPPARISPVPNDLAETLRHAAELLDQEAACLHDSHTLDGAWDDTLSEDRHDHESHDDMRDTAQKLHEAANQLSPP